MDLPAALGVTRDRVPASPKLSIQLESWHLEVPMFAHCTDGFNTSPQPLKGHRPEVPELIKTKELHSIPIAANAPSGFPQSIMRTASLGWGYADYVHAGLGLGGFNFSIVGLYGTIDTRGCAGFGVGFMAFWGPVRFGFSIFNKIKIGLG